LTAGPGAAILGAMAGHNSLELDAATMRELGYRVVDLLVERIAGLGDEPAWQAGDRVALENVLREPPPENAESFDILLDRLVRDVLPHAARVDHPRFLGFVPGSPTWPGILGDFIAAGYNIFQGSWLGGSGASAIELVVTDWFREWIGYPDSAAGLFTSGGSVANLTAIACARHLRYGRHCDRAVLYLSAECHSSVGRAARILGFAPDCIHSVPADAVRGIDPGALHERIRSDRSAGLEPFLIVANAGTTSTGAVDPLRRLSEIAHASDCWLHVDAAYGGFAVLTDRGRQDLDGIDLADSVTLDPHKWLFQPFEAGCLLLREGDRLETAFRVLPDYLQDARLGDRADRLGPVNFMDRGIQLTRSARALKVWLSLKYFGMQPFRDAIERAMDLAIEAEAGLTRSGRFQILSPARLGIVCFRRTVDDRGRHVDGEVEIERANSRLVSSLSESGRALISSTRIDGRYALRFCILNHRTTSADLSTVIDWLGSAPFLPQA
jgi:aromatic-L-amino-acid/L-tryptophan decarboxylase